MIRSKRCATLLEVLIAMALTMLVLMTLMFFYREVGVIGKEIDTLKTQDFYMRYVENRLADVLPKAVSTTDKAGDFVFFSTGDEGITKPGSQSLIFTFDNGVSLDKQFSNHVLGRLYLDPQGRLMLAYWPSPKRWEKVGSPPIKKEVLLEGVDSLAFEFFVAPDKSRKSSGKEEQEKTNKNKEEQQKAEPEPKGDWRLQPWLKEFNELPTMIKVIVKKSKEKDKLTFVFPVAYSKTHIVY